METISVKEYKYAIVATNKELLHEAFQLTKLLLKSGCVSFEEYNFNDTLVKDINGDLVFYRLCINYHRSINFTIVDNEHVSYDGYTYNFRRITESGVTLYGFLTRYLNIERIEYSMVGMAEKWRELVDMSEKMEKLMHVPRNKDVKRILNNVYGRGGRGILAPIVLIDEVVYSELDSYSMQKLLEEMEMNRRFEIKKVIFNDPATIVIWANGAKTVVKAQNEKYDPEKGLAMAFAKRALGGKGSYYDIFKQWLPNEKVDFNDFEKFEKAVQKEAEHELKTYLGKQDK